MNDTKHLIQKSTTKQRNDDSSQAKIGEKMIDLRVESKINLKQNVYLLHLLFDKSNWGRKSTEIWEARMHLQAPKQAEKSLAAECNALTFINIIIDLLLSNAQNTY